MLNKTTNVYYIYNVSKFLCVIFFNAGFQSLTNYLKSFLLICLQLIKVLLPLSCRLTKTKNTIMTTQTKKQVKKGDVINVQGRRWFDKINGNTYFTAEVILNGESVVKCPFQYGYEDQYLQVAMQEFWKQYEAPNGFNVERTHERYLNDYGIVFTTSVKDGLKRELHKF